MRMKKEIIEEPVPVPVWEVMTEFNQRSTFGRIVVNPPTRMAKLSAHKTGEAWYFCGKCSRGFLHREKLLKHNEEHKKKRILEIKAMDKEKSKSSINASLGLLSQGKARLYKKKSTIEVHKRKIVKGCNSIGNGKYQCRFCIKAYDNSSTLSRHSQTHVKTRPHKCLQCGAGFNVRTHLQQHIKKSHSPSHTFQCEHCCCKFQNKIGLRSHKTMYHSKNAFMTQDVLVSGTINKNPVLTKNSTNTTKVKVATDVFKTKFKIIQTDRLGSLANEVVKSQENLFHKLRQRVKPSGKTNGKEMLKVLKTVNKNNLSSNSKSDQSINQNPLLHQCDICKKYLSTPSTLKFHNLIHTGERPYPCEYCGIRFRLTNTRWKHIKLAHSGTGTYQCTYCDCSYATKSVLSQHVLKFHQNS